MTYDEMLKTASTRPWKHCEYDGVIEDANGVDICEAFSNRSDSALIITAVNAFQPMVQALEKIADYSPGSYESRIATDALAKGVANE